MPSLLFCRACCSWPISRWTSSGSLGSPAALAEVIEAVREHDVLDARRREILALLRLTRPTTADEALAVLPEEVRAHAEELLARVEGRPLSYAGQLRREAAQALRRLRKERHDEQVRRLRESVLDLERAGDVEAVRETLRLLDQLKMAFPEFYPEPSPYFRDVRDPAS